jgi:uncharacterized protein
MINKTLPAAALLLYLIIMGTGCASIMTQQGQYAGLEDKVSRGDFDEAIKKVESAKYKEYKEKERVLYYLDLGLLYHYNGEYKKSNELLDLADRTIEDLYAKSVSRAAGSLLLNDNVLEYSGEDYEDIYLNIFKALNYIGLHDDEAAMVEIRRLDEKLSGLEDKYSPMIARLNTSEHETPMFERGQNHFINSVLGRYLSFLLYRSREEYDEANIDLLKIRETWSLQPALYDFKIAEIPEKASSAAGIPVSIISFTGKGPIKYAETLRIHTQENTVFVGHSKSKSGEDTSLNIAVLDWYGMEGGYHFKFQLPRISASLSDVALVTVKIDDGQPVVLGGLESLENAAMAAYKIKEPIIFLKTVSRTLIKGVMAEKTKDRLEENVENPALSIIGRILADIAVDISEQADLRISRFFPAMALGAELSVAPGLHTIRIEYYNEKGKLLRADERKEEIKEDGLNLIESVYLR